MGARGAQWYRDVLRRGDRVTVIVRQGAVVHRRKARVLATLRHGAKLLFEGGKEATVRPAAVERIAAPLPEDPDEPHIPDRDDIDAWIEMGRGLLGTISAEIESIGQQVHRLGDERDAIEAEIEGLLERKKHLQKRVDVLRRLGDE